MMPTRAKGFTLIELLVTIVIVAILLAIGLPSFSDSLRSNRIATTTNELLASLSLARSEAMRSTHASRLCASSDGTSCGTDWNQGWMVSTDTNGDGTYDSIVRYVQGHNNLSLVVTGGSSASVLVFDSRGRPDNAGVDRVMTLKPSDCRTGMQLQRKLTLKTVGQVNTKKEACP